ncbi:MAG: hypothetical protein ACI4BD_03450 [Paludibacteraceae bacterium]
MNKITFPRVGYDGKERSQKEIGNWYVGELLRKGIRETVKNLVNTKFELSTEEDRKILHYLQDNTIEDILLCPPDKIYETIKELEYIRNITSANKKDNNKAFRKAIADAFNYDNYRQNVLVELSKMLNVKVCPYCNMQYTLFAEEEGRRQKVKQLAKFQFDHFVNKTAYPMFSMSLYNLIPSCAVCNQGKLKRKLPLELNPYQNDIHKLFHFEVKEPLHLLTGKKVDKVEIDIESTKGNEKIVTTYVDTFHISTLYSRHKDIVQEIYEKAYIAPSTIDIAKLLHTDEKRLLELWYGTYLDEKDIEKRPLTKFIQDIKKQSESIF